MDLGTLAQCHHQDQSPLSELQLHEVQAFPVSLQRLSRETKISGLNTDSMFYMRFVHILLTTCPMPLVLQNEWCCHAQAGKYSEDCYDPSVHLESNRIFQLCSALRLLQAPPDHGELFEGPGQPEHRNCRSRSGFCNTSCCFKYL